MTSNPVRPEPCPHQEDCAERRSCLGRRCRPVDEQEAPGTIFVMSRKWSAAPNVEAKAAGRRPVAP